MFCKYRPYAKESINIPSAPLTTTDVQSALNEIELNLLTGGFLYGVSAVIDGDAL